MHKRILKRGIIVLAIVFVVNTCPLIPAVAAEIDAENVENASEIVVGNVEDASEIVVSDEVEEVPSKEEKEETADVNTSDNDISNQIERDVSIDDSEEAIPVDDSDTSDANQVVSEDTVTLEESTITDEELEPDVYVNENPALPAGNHIYFYNIETEKAGSSDMILLESNGRWGLIDTGHRYESTITDKDGTMYATDVSKLSCQIPGKYGMDAMKYMVETLGVDHLDFIIGTHSHSDHIGGIPEIASLLVGESDGSVHPLIDETTVYFYKSYFHTGAQDDDLGPNTIRYSWHNQAFFYQAKQAIVEQGSQPVDISCGIKTSEGRSVSADQSGNLSIIESSGNFENISYEARSNTNPFDDRISFRWGDMEMDLYHLFAVDGAINENVNSIVTVITCNGYKIYLAGDMDTQFQTEQKIAKVIASDHGHFDVVKMSHHGIANGSNSKGLIDSLQPEIMISTNYWTNFKSPTIGGVYSSVKYYSGNQYGTSFYGVGASDRMLDVSLDGGNIGVYNITGAGANVKQISGEDCRDSGRIIDGWSGWHVEHYSNTITNWYYFVNNKPVIGWYQTSGDWYYFDSDGFMQTGWISYNGKYYYLDDAMQTGWKKIDGEWYYFNPNGTLLQNGWAKDSVGWCYMGSDGKIVKSKWIYWKGEWYYLKGNGYMTENNWAEDSKGWCYMGSDGKIVKSKWVYWKEEWYYLKGNGYMTVDNWAEDSHGWCYMDSNGAVTKSKWIYWKGEWYYLKSNGYMAANEYASDRNYRYWMGNDGTIKKTYRK